jgi:hypothetical protein
MTSDPQQELAPFRYAAISQQAGAKPFVAEPRREGADVRAQADGFHRFHAVGLQPLPQPDASRNRNVKVAR